MRIKTEWCLFWNIWQVLIQSQPGRVEMFLLRDVDDVEGEGEVEEHSLRKHPLGVNCPLYLSVDLPQMHRTRTLDAIFEFHDFSSMFIAKVVP